MWKWRRLAKCIESRIGQLFDHAHIHYYQSQCTQRNKKSKWSFEKWKKKIENYPTVTIQHTPSGLSQYVNMTWIHVNLRPHKRYDDAKRRRRYTRRTRAFCYANANSVSRECVVKMYSVQRNSLRSYEYKLRKLCHCLFNFVIYKIVRAGPPCAGPRACTRTLQLHICLLTRSHLRTRSATVSRSAGRPLLPMIHSVRVCVWTTVAPVCVCVWRVIK